MARKTPENLIEGRFRNLIYSPKGGIEGVLLEVDGAPAQLVFERHDEAAPAAFEGVASGQLVVVEATPEAPSSKGPAEHPVYAFAGLRTVDGLRPKKPSARPAAAYRGKVVRFNYARHGAANGVVLDSGDFIHTRPEGLARLKLKVGDTVEADGDAHFLASGGGWAVEASKVNGKAVERS